MSRFLERDESSGAEEDGDWNVRVLLREIVILSELDDVRFRGGIGHEPSGAFMIA